MLLAHGFRRRGGRSRSGADATDRLGPRRVAVVSRRRHVRPETWLATSGFPAPAPSREGAASARQQCRSVALTPSHGDFALRCRRGGTASQRRLRVLPRRSLVGQLAHISPACRSCGSYIGVPPLRARPGAVATLRSLMSVGPLGRADAKLEIRGSAQPLTDDSRRWVAARDECGFKKGDVVDVQTQAILNLAALRGGIAQDAAGGVDLHR